MRTFEQYVREAVDFRLGGSKNKGNLVKTFRELEKGDEIYFYNVDLNKSECKKFKYTFDHYGSPSWQSKNSTETYMFFSRTSGDTELDSIGMSKERMACSIEVSIVASNYYKIFSTVDLTEEEVIEKVSNMTKRGKSEMYESVDFRLGGSKNKGDNLHKKFEELEPGDSIYVYELTPDGKRTRTNIFDYKKRRRYSNNSSSYFFIGEWRNEKLKMSKTILLSRDCYERSAFHSYKTMVWSTYEMTDEELAEFVNNKDNEMRY